MFTCIKHKCMHGYVLDMSENTVAWKFLAHIKILQTKLTVSITICGVAKLSTYDRSIYVVPLVIADSSPPPTKAEFHTAFQSCGPSNQAKWSVLTIWIGNCIIKLHKRSKLTSLPTGNCQVRHNMIVITNYENCCTSHTHSSYMTLIGVHEIHGRVHPN